MFGAEKLGHQWAERGEKGNIFMDRDRDPWVARRKCQRSQARPPSAPGVGLGSQ